MTCEEHSIIPVDNTILTTKNGVRREPIMETRLLVVGLSGSGKSSMLKALLGTNFDASSKGTSSSKMLFEPYQALIQLPSSNDASDRIRKKFIIKACDTRGLNDPNHLDEDTFETIKTLYSSEFNLINHVFVCFKFDRIRAEVHTSIVNLINYLKEAGFKSENICVALTFTDGINEEEIDSYVKEMKEHEVVKDLFLFASKIFIVTLPELSTITPKWRTLFEETRDQTIENLIEHLTHYVKPVQILSHEQFQIAVQEQARSLSFEQVQIQKNEIEDLKVKLAQVGERYHDVREMIKKKANEALDNDVTRLENEKEELQKVIQDLQKTCASKKRPCVIA